MKKLINKLKSFNWKFISATITMILSSALLGGAAASVLQGNKIDAILLLLISLYLFSYTIFTLLSDFYKFVLDIVGAFLEHNKPSEKPVKAKKESTIN